MRKKVTEWIKTQNLIVPGDLVLAACSGGPDSVALVHLLADLRSLLSFTLAVVHVNHLLRGADSFADAEFVANFCKYMGLDCYQTEIDVRSFAKQDGHSLEETARILRYQYLQSLADRLGATKIATGHHRDDQAETVLLNLLRGAGSGGLRGMLPGIERRIIRPFLAVDRRSIADYCQEYGLAYRLDSTNLSTDYLRNKIRLELLPMLAREYNPAISDTLCRTAAIMAEQNDFFQQAAQRLLAETTAMEDGNAIIRLNGIKNLHIALQREFFRTVIKKKQGHLKGISFYHVEKLIEMVNCCQVGKMLRLPGGLLAKRGYQTIDISMEQFVTQSADRTLIFGLTVPGKTEIKEMGIIVLTETVTEWNKISNKNVAVFDQSKLFLPLFVRARLPGDRFWPLGSTGGKKLKSFLIDHKIPADIRDSIPLICDQQGILWVGGYRQAERGKVLPSTRQYLQVTINQTGGNVSC